MIHHPTHACPDFLKSFSDFVDGTLSPGRRAEYQAHLDCCEGCLRHLAAYRRGIEVLAERPEVEVEPVAFWARLQHGLWHESVEERAVRRPAWRVPSFAGLATAAVAIAVIWTGMRIGEGLDRVAERAEPVVVVAEPASVADPPVPPASRIAPASRVTPATAPRPVQRASAEPARRTEARFSDPVLERQFQALRARIETEAWLGPPQPVVSYATLESGGLRSRGDGARIRPADTRPTVSFP